MKMASRPGLQAADTDTVRANPHAGKGEYLLETFSNFFQKDFEILFLQHLYHILIITLCDGKSHPAGTKPYEAV